MIGYDKLTQFLGGWEGAEQLFATAWTPAGQAQAVVTLSPGPNDALLLDYVEERDGMTMTGHGVIAAGAWWWFDSYGFTPTTPGTSRWESGELILERSSERGRTTTTLAIVDGRLEQRIDTAVPADAELTPLLRGTYTPQAHPNLRSD
jgi:hypothetical protein